MGFSNSRGSPALPQAAVTLLIPAPWAPTRCENSTLFLWQLALSVHGSRWNRRRDPLGTKEEPGLWCSGHWRCQCHLKAHAHPFLRAPGIAGHSHWPMPLGRPGSFRRNALHPGALWLQLQACSSL